MLSVVFHTRPLQPPSIALESIATIFLAKKLPKDWKEQGIESHRLKFHILIFTMGAGC